MIQHQKTREEEKYTKKTKKEKIKSCINPLPIPPPRLRLRLRLRLGIFIPLPLLQLPPIFPNTIPLMVIPNLLLPPSPHKSTPHAIPLLEQQINPPLPLLLALLHRPRDALVQNRGRFVLDGKRGLEALDFGAEGFQLRFLRGVGIAQGLEFGAEAGFALFGC